MQQSYDLYFASSNIHKFQEAKKILDNFGISLGFFKCNLEEIQSDSLKNVKNPLLLKMMDYSLILSMDFQDHILLMSLKRLETKES